MTDVLTHDLPQARPPARPPGVDHARHPANWSMLLLPCSCCLRQKIVTLEEKMPRAPDSRKSHTLPGHLSRNAAPGVFSDNVLMSMTPGVYGALTPKSRDRLVPLSIFGDGCGGVSSLQTSMPAGQSNRLSCRRHSLVFSQIEIT